MAKFKPGKSGNPNGRPAGAPNKLTKQLRAVLKGIMADELENLPNLLAELEPAQRIEAVLKLMKFCLPSVGPVAASYGEPMNMYPFADD